jgi:inhibitor of KinA sporulation pathway (predicted exonuclease)
MYHQDQVNAAEDFPTVLKRVNDWFRENGLGDKFTFTVAADGPWDFQKFLYMQCGHSGIQYPTWAHSWIDVRKMFSIWFGVSILLHLFCL